MSDFWTRVEDGLPKLHKAWDEPKFYGSEVVVLLWQDIDRETGLPCFPTLRIGEHEDIEFGCLTKNENGVLVWILTRAGHELCVDDEFAPTHWAEIPPLEKK